MYSVKEYRPNDYLKKSPFFSIIIVSYNYGHTLKRTLSALKKQTFKDFEIVIVDNGSLDDTDALVNRFINRNNNLYITHVKIEENNGLPQGRNLGIENSHGEYIIFNDADDWMDSTCLYEMMKATQGGKIDRVMVQMRDVSPEGKILQIRKYTKDMSQWLVTQLQGNAFRRSFFEEYNIRVPDTFEDDMYITLSFSCHTRSYAVIRKTLYNFMINKNSTSGANSITAISRIEELLNDVIGVINPVRKHISKSEWEFLEYQLIKCYYNLIFHYNRNRKYSDIKKVYSVLNSTMINYDKKYLKNKKLTLRKNGDRLYGRLLAFMFSRIEKVHLMVPVIYLYVFVSKLVYFNV